jgi:hypothetical protein
VSGNGPDGGKRTGQPSCTANKKWIVSFAAIVTSCKVMMVRGASVLVAPARPATSLLLFTTRLHAVLLCFVPPYLIHLLLGP